MKRRNFLSTISLTILAGCATTSDSKTNTPQKSEYKTNGYWTDYQGPYRQFPYEINITQKDDLGYEHGIKLVVIPKENAWDGKQIVKYYGYDSEGNIAHVKESSPAEINSPTQFTITWGLGVPATEYFKIDIIKAD